MPEATSAYLSIVAMLVESYILESAWSLASAISVTLNSPIYMMFTTNDSMIKVCDLPVASVISLSYTSYSRSLPTFLLFIVLRLDGGGPNRRKQSSQPYSGTMVPPPVTIGLEYHSLQP